MTWAVVTGAARGLGAKVAALLAAGGQDVLVHYHKSDPTSVLEVCSARGVRVEALSADFSNRTDVERFCEGAFRNNRTVSSLVNNVGPYHLKPLQETSLSEWEALFQVNVFAPVLITKRFVAALSGRSGAVVNMGVAGIQDGKVIRRTPLYALTKRTLLHYTKGLARELAPSGTRVNMVSPGEMEGSEDFARTLVKPSTLPMRRPATWDEVARWVVHLLDPQESAYVTGQNIEVAGGYSL